MDQKGMFVILAVWANILKSGRLYEESHGFDVSSEHDMGEGWTRADATCPFIIRDRFFEIKYILIQTNVLFRDLEVIRLDWIGWDSIKFQDLNRVLSGDHCILLRLPAAVMTNIHRPHDIGFVNFELEYQPDQGPSPLSGSCFLSETLSEATELTATYNCTNASTPTTPSTGSLWISPTTVTTGISNTDQRQESAPPNITELETRCPKRPTGVMREVPDMKNRLVTSSAMFVKNTSNALQCGRMCLNTPSCLSAFFDTRGKQATCYGHVTIFTTGSPSIATSYFIVE